ncbi:hypothetical protein [Streptomyces sp. NPDC005408]|uniref:hypothetical protein n=1 Tax=Streptomyces sp. NPDC005408 TaxID=3155341 RepID=UPI0033B2130D
MTSTHRTAVAVPRTTAGPSRQARKLYLVIGVVLALIWAARAEDPPWQHALRTLGLMLVILPAATLLLRRKQARTGIQLPELRHLNIFAAKFLLVAAALGAEWLLQSHTQKAAHYVAIGIAVVVALVGPRLSRFFIKQSADPAP